MHILQHFPAAFCPFLFVPFLLRVLALSRSGIREDTHGHSRPFLSCAPSEQMISLTKGLLSMSLVGLIHKENSYWHNCSSVQESQATSLLPCLWSSALSLCTASSTGPTAHHTPLSEIAKTHTAFASNPGKAEWFPEISGLSEYGHLESKGKQTISVYLVVFVC